MAAAAEARLELAALRRREPLGVEPVPAHELEPPAQLGRLVAIERNVQGAELEEPRVEAARRAQLVGELGPERVGAESELEQAVLSPARLADRRQHPGGDVRGTASRLVALEHEHVKAALGGAPRAGKADDSGADDDDVVLSICVRWCHRFLSPGRADLASPCAGITRIRFRRSAARRRPLSPICCRAPVVLQDTPRDASGENGCDQAVLPGVRERRCRGGPGAGDRRHRLRSRELQRARFGVSREASDQVRAATAEYLDPIGGMTWKPLRVRGVGRDFAVVETEVGIEGRSSGINVLARGGWLARFEGELIAEGVLHQSYEDALARGATTGARRRTPVFRLRGAPPRQRPVGRCSRAAIEGGVDVIQTAREGAALRRGADRFLRAVRARRPRARRALLPQRRAWPGRSLRRRRRPRRPGRRSGGGGPRGGRAGRARRPLDPQPGRSSTPRWPPPGPLGPTRSAPGPSGRRRRSRAARRPGSS